MIYFTLALTLGYDIDRFEVVESSIDKTGDSRGRIHELRQFQHHWALAANLSEFWAYLQGNFTTKLGNESCAIF